MQDFARCVGCLLVRSPRCWLILCPWSGADSLHCTLHLLRKVASISCAPPSHPLCRNLKRFGQVVWTPIRLAEICNRTAKERPLKTPPSSSNLCTRWSLVPTASGQRYARSLDASQSKPFPLFWAVRPVRRRYQVTLPFGWWYKRENVL